MNWSNIATALGLQLSYQILHSGAIMTDEKLRLRWRLMTRRLSFKGPVRC